MATDTQTIEVRLSGDLLQRIDRRAQEQGSDRSRLIEELIEKGLKDEAPPRAGRTFAQILEPFHRGFEQSGMTEEELTDLMETELKAVRTESRRKGYVS